MAVSCGRQAESGVFGEESDGRAAGRVQAGASTMNLIRDEDVPYEESLIQNPFNLKTWIRYSSTAQNDFHRLWLLKRSVQQLPGSYKLWIAYLHLVLDCKPTLSNGFITSQFKNALVLLNKMPMLWKLYLEYLMQHATVTETRRTFNRALQSIPITQHSILWKIMLPYIQNVGGETLVRLYKRYLKLNPDAKEEFLELLLKHNRHSDAIIFNCGRSCLSLLSTIQTQFRQN